jgi:hypothetical protein
MVLRVAESERERERERKRIGRNINYPKMVLKIVTIYRHGSERVSERRERETGAEHTHNLHFDKT